MKSKAILAALLALLPIAAARAAEPELRYVVIVSRHGVRSPTWDNARLNGYSSLPWPEWGVAPGELTPHGFRLMEILGQYYGDWLRGRKLLGSAGCDEAAHIFIRADSAQRTLETGRAFGESLLPGCTVPVHALKPGEADGLFDPIASKLSVADPAKALAALRERLGDPAALMRRDDAAFRVLQTVLTGSAVPKNPVVGPGAAIGVQSTAKGSDLTGPLNLASTFSENFLLEYLNGFAGSQLGWGRLDEKKLMQILTLHGEYARLTRETPYLARKRGWNLLNHIVNSMQQAVTGQASDEALGPVDDRLLVISGHDTNLSNLAGMLGLEWQTGGYQKNETPPGAALVFLLLRDSAGAYQVRVRFVAQTLREMRELDSVHPPASVDIEVPGCGTRDCSWTKFEQVVRASIAEARK